uniref:Uncharacterized protein n=1 Tax=Cacopsylla melanoneura TaxID=428564 RepID=A0A8D9EDC3_9HEMI
MNAVIITIPCQVIIILIYAYYNAILMLFVWFITYYRSVMTKEPIGQLESPSPSEVKVLMSDEIREWPLQYDKHSCFTQTKFSSLSYFFSLIWSFASTQHFVLYINMLDACVYVQYIVHNNIH